MSQKVYCLYCGYCLNNIGIKGDCPECGEGYDKGLRNGVSYESLEKMNTISKARYIGLGLLCVAFFVAILALVLSAMITDPSIAGPVTTAGAFVVLGLIVGGVWLFGFYKPRVEDE